MELLVKPEPNDVASTIGKHLTDTIIYKEKGIAWCGVSGVKRIDDHIVEVEANFGQKFRIEVTKV